jgi:nucleotide-binding universal stress UspA family protein
MEGIRKIVAAIDFSLHSDHVFSTAAALAQRLSAELILVNVINQRDVDAVEMVERDYPGISVDRYIQRIVAERTELAESLIAKSGAGPLKVKKIFKVGLPFKEILETVGLEGAELLVMGTRGRGHITDVLFGSTAEKVFRRCPVPLLSVRRAEDFS